MGNFIKTQSSFAHGEVAPEFYAYDDINALAKLENMDVLAGGGLRRRSGLTTVYNLTSDARLIPFSVDSDDDYLLAICDERIIILKNGELYQNMLSPFPATALPKLQYAQRFGTMIFVHPDYKPRILEKTGNLFELTIFNFAQDLDTTIHMPFMRYEDTDDITITLSDSELGGNFAVFTTNKAFWTSAHVGGMLELAGHQWTIYSYTSPTVVVASTNGAYTTPSSSVTDWREAAFSPYRGWPCSITFHQDRLVFGGSRSYPCGVWLSQVGRHHNFDVGTGLDDEAIYLTLMSDKRQQICTVVSSDNLQILTSVGEWAISSKPLTPSNIDVLQHTSVGCMSSRYLPPQKIEGATVFVSGTGRDIRELSLDDLAQRYNANDLSAMAKHLMASPTDMAYNDATRQLFVVMADGYMAVLNQNSALGISAWTSYKTLGDFKSVAIMGGRTYVVVSRTTGYAVEVFDTTAMKDAGTLDFSFTASALPLRASGHNASKLRVRKINARLLDTKSLFINNARAPIPHTACADDAAGYTGDVTVNILGTTSDCITSPWVLHGSDAEPATILSVTMHGYYVV